MSISNEPDATPGASNAGNTGTSGTGGGSTPGTTGTEPDVGGGTAGSGATTPVPHPDRYSWAPYVVGIAVLLGYAIFLNEMIGNVRVKEQNFWDRYLYLFSSVEALAFAAAGFFFGREVNRGRAEAAETQAKTQAKRASTAEEKKADARAKGQVLAESLQALADGSGAGPGPSAMGHDIASESYAAPAAVPAGQVRGLANLANHWFPRR